MQDILYDAAIIYEKLKDIVYKIVVGRKGKSYSIMLHFPSYSVKPKSIDFTGFNDFYLPQNKSRK